MTRNQIEYWRLKETERANRAQEQHNANVLNYNYEVLAETKRANLARERETFRSNYAREVLQRDLQNRNYYLSLRQQTEVERANRANEKIAKQRLDETVRANKATERLQQLSQQTAALNAQTSARRQVELERQNRVNESLSMLNYGESVRSHKAQERNSLQNLNETIRSHQANERIQASQQRATERYQAGQLQLGLMRQQEINRSNRANEMLKAVDIALKPLSQIEKNNRRISTYGTGQQTGKAAKASGQ